MPKWRRSFKILEKSGDIGKIGGFLEFQNSRTPFLWSDALLGCRNFVSFELADK